MITWTFGDVNLSDFGIIEDLGSSDDLPPVRGENPTVPLRTGRIYVPKLFDARRFTLGLLVDGESAEDLQIKLDELRALMGSRSEQELVKTLDSGETRTAMAEAVGQLSVKRISPQTARCVLDFSLADPFFYSSELFTQEITVNESPKTDTLINPGTAPVRKALITLDCFLDQPKITNNMNGVWLQFLSSIGEAESVEIDCDEFTAYRGEDNVISSLIHAGDAAFMLLEPGPNLLEIETGTLAGLVTIAFYPPYL